MRLQKVGSFDAPVYVTAPPGDKRRLFVVEQGGKIRVRQGRQDARARRSSTSATRSRPAASRACCRWPSRPTTRRAGCSTSTTPTPTATTQVVEYQRASRRRGRPGLRAHGCSRSRRPEPNHNGGLLLFGPDKLLYIGIGDGGGGGRPARRARQRPEPRHAARQDPAHRPAGRPAASPYTIPADNPFVGRAGARGEIYSYGLRNPWRFSFDRSTGDLTIGDVGQDEVEEIDFVRKGKGARRELRLARVRGQRPLHAGRDGAGRDQAGDHRAATPTATARSPAASWSATRRCRRGAGATCSATSAAA